MSTDLMSNDSSDDSLMELSDDYTEEVKGAGVDDNTTASEMEQEPKRPKNPFIQYSQAQRKLATEHFQKQNVEFTEALSKKVTKVVAEDWKALPKKKKPKQSAAQGSNSMAKKFD